MRIRVNRLMQYASKKRLLTTKQATSRLTLTKEAHSLQHLADLKFHNTKAVGVDKLFATWDILLATMPTLKRPNG